MVAPYRARLRREVRDLNPGYGALVMATAIVSTGLGQLGQRALSDVLLILGCVAFVVLLAAYASRLMAYRRRALHDARDPSQAFGDFSLVAAADVLAVRFASDHHATVTLVLGAASAPVWLLLTYGIPGAVVLGRQHGPVLPGSTATGSCGWWRLSRCRPRRQPWPAQTPTSRRRWPRWQWRCGAPASCSTCLVDPTAARLRGVAARLSSRATAV